MNITNSSSSSESHHSLGSGSIAAIVIATSTLCAMVGVMLYAVFKVYRHSPGLARVSDDVISPEQEQKDKDNILKEMANKYGDDLF